MNHTVNTVTLKLSLQYATNVGFQSTQQLNLFYLKKIITTKNALTVLVRIFLSMNLKYFARTVSRLNSDECFKKTILDK